LGIGNSAMAAQECGLRRFIGFDIEAEYVEVARKALAAPGKVPSPELF
jgi:DNA modification methylase